MSNPQTFHIDPSADSAAPTPPKSSEQRPDELDGERPEQPSTDAPATFGATLIRIVRLTPGIYVPVLGYTFGWAVVFTLAMSLSFLCGFATLGLGLLVTGVGLIFALGVTACFWTAIFRRIHNTYCGRERNTEWSYAINHFSRIMGVFAIKAVVVAPFAAATSMALDSAVGGRGISMTSVAFVAAAVVATYGVVLFIHFADLTAIVEELRVGDSFAEAISLVRKPRQLAYTTALFGSVGLMTAAVVISMWFGISFAGGIFLVDSVAALISVAAAFALLWLVSPLILCANYMIYRSVSARSA